MPQRPEMRDLLQWLIALSEREREQSEEVLPAELLATVGHEFRGPLTTIQGYATTLLRQDQQLAPQERQDFLQAISDASTHLGKLVNRFLELAQFETNALPFVPASVDLVALAQEAIIAVQKTRPHALILTPPQLNRRSSGEQPEETPHRDALAVSGDRRWLRTMLDILLENAVAYSPQEGLIEVSIEPADPVYLRTALSTYSGPDNHVALILPGTFQEHEALLAIRVRDHGRGIPPEQLSRIFQRFYRVDTRLTRDVNGLGLGLALCKAIVALHRGMLWVESRMGVGSTFHILLPREATATIREMV
ncbi:MAG: HAMP domain-containing sensor histidine kinase [Ktedonobacteraceae bacterium]